MGNQLNIPGEWVSGTIPVEFKTQCIRMRTKSEILLSHIQAYEYNVQINFTKTESYIFLSHCAACSQHNTCNMGS